MRAVQGGGMAEKEEQSVLVKEIQARFVRKFREQEISILEYWKEQVEQVAALKPEGIAALQMHVRKISDRMANRIRTLKREQ
jgi:glutamate synthase domain-containing protein 3